MTKPICDTCNDTHRMTLTRDGEANQVVMCTRCPLPCRECGQGGPFCTAAPCGCACHVKRATEEPFNTALKSMRQAITDVGVGLEFARGFRAGRDAAAQVCRDRSNDRLLCRGLDGVTCADAIEKLEPKR